MTYPYSDSTYVNWDWDNVWAADLEHEINGGYPYLQWYAPTPAFYPPQHLIAQQVSQNVVVSWQMPLSGIPVSYNIYRDGILLANTSNLSWTDTDVVFENTYIYAATALYEGGASMLSNSFEIELLEPSDLALLVMDKDSLNAYDTGFINVLNTITTDYEMIDIADISSAQENLSDYSVVISNFMGYGAAAPTAFESIAQELSDATGAGTEFIVGSESVAIPVVLGLSSGGMNGSWGPALNNTRAISELAVFDAITQGVNPIPNYQSYLGQDGSMLADYFDEGVFWKVMSGSIGDYYRMTSYSQFPLFRFNTIYSGWDVSEYQSPGGAMQYLHNDSRILNLERFWTQNNDTRSKGWIGPEGLQVLSNAIFHYQTTDYVQTSPVDLTEVYYTDDGSQLTIHWNPVGDADYYEIWRSSDGTSWGPIGLQREDGSDTYAWLSPLTTDNSYRVRAILGETPGTFVDAIEAIPEEAIIAVYPESMDYSLGQDSIDQVEMEISNFGNMALSWSATVTEVGKPVPASAQSLCRQVGIWQTPGAG